MHLWGVALVLILVFLPANADREMWVVCVVGSIQCGRNPRLSEVIQLQDKTRLANVNQGTWCSSWCSSPGLAHGCRLDRRRVRQCWNTQAWFAALRVTNLVGRTVWGLWACPAQARAVHTTNMPCIISLQNHPRLQSATSFHVGNSGCRLPRIHAFFHKITRPTHTHRHTYTGTHMFDTNKTHFWSPSQCPWDSRIWTICSTTLSQSSKIVSPARAEVVTLSFSPAHVVCLRLCKSLKETSINQICCFVQAGLSLSWNLATFFLRRGSSFITITTLRIEVGHCVTPFSGNMGLLSPILAEQVGGERDWGHIQIGARCGHGMMFCLQFARAESDHVYISLSSQCLYIYALQKRWTPTNFCASIIRFLLCSTCWVIPRQKLQRYWNLFRTCTIYHFILLGFVGITWKKDSTCLHVQIESTPAGVRLSPMYLVSRIAFLLKTKMHTFCWLVPTDM